MQSVLILELRERVVPAECKKVFSSWFVWKQKFQIVRVFLHWRERNPSLEYCFVLISKRACWNCAGATVRKCNSKTGQISLADPWAVIETRSHTKGVDGPRPTDFLPATNTKDLENAQSHQHLRPSSSFGKKNLGKNPTSKEAQPVQQMPSSN